MVGLHLSSSCALKMDFQKHANGSIVRLRGMSLIAFVKWPGNDISTSGTPPTRPLRSLSPPRDKQPVLRESSVPLEQSCEAGGTRGSVWRARNARYAQIVKFRNEPTICIISKQFLE